MFDPDLIQQTVTEVIGQRDSYTYAIIKIVAVIILLVLSLNMLNKKLGKSQRPVRTAEDEEAEMDARYAPSYLDSAGMRSERIKVPLMGVACLHLAGMTLGAMGIGLITNSLRDALIWQGIVQIVIAGIIALHLKKRPRNESLRIEANQMWPTIAASLVIIAAMLAADSSNADSSYLAKSVPIEKTKPTQVAMVEAQRGYGHIVSEVLDTYDVEVASASGCGNDGLVDVPKEVKASASDAEMDLYKKHYRHVEFIKAALKDDFRLNPKLMLSTPSGVTTCYTVRYDQQEDTVRLLISGEEVDAAAPESLRRS